MKTMKCSVLVLVFLFLTLEANANEDASSACENTSCFSADDKSDSTLACEAILCLTANDNSKQCGRSRHKFYLVLCRSYYYSASDVKNFLNLCKNSKSEETKKYIEDIVKVGHIMHGSCNAPGT